MICNHGLTKWGLVGVCCSRAGPVLSTASCAHEVTDKIRWVKCLGAPALFRAVTIFAGHVSVLCLLYLWLTCTASGTCSSRACKITVFSKRTTSTLLLRNLREINHMDQMIEWIHNMEQQLLLQSKLMGTSQSSLTAWCSSRGLGPLPWNCHPAPLCSHSNTEGTNTGTKG